MQWINITDCQFCFATSTEECAKQYTRVSDSNASILLKQAPAIEEIILSVGN